MTAAQVTTIVPRSYDGMTLAVAPAEALRRIQELRAFVQSTMVKGEDYGIIPGTDKPTLFQPGAQKLAEIYGLAHRFELIDSIKDWEHGFFYFEYRAVLTSRRDDRHVCDGIGSCNSRESKYGARWCFESDIPEGMAKASLKSKTIVSKKPGRNQGKEFTMYQIPNPDIYSIVNTLQKMACKRAYVMAVISATRSAGLFTQDVEDADIPEEAFGEPEATRSWEKEPSEDPAAAFAAKLRTSLSGAKTVEEMRTAWGGVGVALRSKWITEEQKDDLIKVRDARLAELGVTVAPATAAATATPPAAARPPSVPPPAAGPQAPASTAGAPSVACGICKKPVATAAALPFRSAGGGILMRHAACSPPSAAPAESDGPPPDDWVPSDPDEGP